MGAVAREGFGREVVDLREHAAHLVRVGVRVRVRVGVRFRGKFS